MSLVFQEEYGDEAVRQAQEWAAAHSDFICAVFDVFLETGRWPSPTVLQRDLDRAGASIDVHGLSKELPRQLGAPWRGPDGEIVLRIRALHHCDRAQPILRAAVALLSLAYSRYLSDEEEPKLTAADLTSRDHEAAAMLLQYEVFHIIRSSHDRVVPEWEGHVNVSLVREVKDVRSVEEYLAVEAGFFKREAYPPAAVGVASRTGVGTLPVEVQPAAAGAAATTEPLPDPRRVLVVHGRNLALRDAMFAFLRAINLDPLEFSEARRLTGKATPYIGEVLTAAFNHAQAVVVLMSPDDVAYLREEFRDPKRDPGYESAPTGSARLNVIFEAGISMGRDERRTVLVECGSVRPFSDIGGRHALRLDNSVARRQELAERLEDAGCAVVTQGKTDWHGTGNFEPPDLDFEPAVAARPESVNEQPPLQGTGLPVSVEPVIEGARIFLRILNESDARLVLSADVMDVVGLDRNVATPWPMVWRSGGDVREVPPGWPQLLLVADGDGMGNSREFRGGAPLEVARWQFHTPGAPLIAKMADISGSQDIVVRDVNLRIRIAQLAGPWWRDVALRIGFQNRNDAVSGNLAVRAEVIE